ncbi:MAG: hypothetical protein OXS29_07990 [bacterium]|nr:hypothetical protein [bacterium]MDE0287335.1 hypothetical protein [bacterium]MDE0439154.1 hypothetical protein [bacterium]
MGVHRLISLYLALVAVAVAMQFVAFPIYAYDSDGETLAAALDVWHVLDWFMAAGLALMAVSTCREKRRHRGDGPADVRQWLRSNLMFFGTVVLALAFVPNWFEAAWGHNQNWTIWHLVDTVLPVMFLAEAHRLWRASSV